MADRRRTPARAALSFLVAASMLFTDGRYVAAASPAGATNSRMAREDATRSVPFAKLDSELAPKIKRVIAKPSVFRRLPVQVIDSDPKMFHFLLNNPEVIVNIWQVMGITKVRMTRTGPNTYEASDGNGAKGDVHIAYSNQDTQVIYCEGIYDGPMFPKPLRAQCVLVVKAGFVQETNRRYYVTARCDAFIHFEHMGLELLAKTFQPMVNKSADINFVETAAFVSTVSRTSELKPTGMAKLGNRLQNVSPEVREEFITVSQQVAVRARKNGAALAQSDTRGTPQLRAQR